MKEKINKNEKETNNQKKAEKDNFESIKLKKLFKDLFKSENRIKRDFHGNRDFYNLIKGIAIEFGSLDENFYFEKVAKIIRYIERNFGGIDYEIDIDYDLNLDGIRENIQLIKDIVRDYSGSNKKKINSVYLFKKLYNLELEKEDPNSKLIIKKERIMEYNLNICINRNILDVNSRFLLLEISKSLTNVICQLIKLWNPYKNIIIYDGSLFSDANKKEYGIKILNQIQEKAREDCLIILENLNQILPFLFGLFDMNYIIKNDKKFIKICLEDLNEQLTQVNENFRIIILVDRTFVNRCDLSFLNRFEKMNLSFDKLLDSNLKKISQNLIDEIRFKSSIRKYNNINYSLSDLLINCRDEEIQAMFFSMIYYFRKGFKKIGNKDYEKEENKIDIGKLRENVINKIYKILPQDIICILQESNIIRQYYNENAIFYNFKDYINEEEKKNINFYYIYFY